MTIKMKKDEKMKKTKGNTMKIIEKIKKNIVIIMRDESV